MSCSEEEKRDILRKVLRYTIQLATRGKSGFAPDILIDPAIERAKEIIAKYEDRPEVDIWKNGRLDLYTRHLVTRIMLENLYDYELSEENFEAVNALIEAEEMLGETANDDDLEELFDYTPEELERLRILAKYIGGIDKEATYREFSKKYGL